jgi:hypothetical protein
VFLLAPLAAAAESAPPGITRLKAMHLETVLVRDGVAACKIVTPADDTWRQLGRTVSDAVRAQAGVALEVVDAEAIAPADYGKSGLILLGNLNNNVVVRKLYSQHYCVTDAVYPGPGGWEVRTIHNPMGWGVNFVLLGASDLAGAQAAVRQFTSLLADRGAAAVLRRGRSLALARLCLSESAQNHAEGGEAQYFATTTAQLRQRLEAGEILRVANLAGDVAMRYYQTGRPVYGRVFRDFILRYCELAEPNEDWVLTKTFGGDSDRYFFPLHLMPAWELIETGDVFSDAERLRITNLLLNITRWLTRLPYFDPTTPNGKRYATPGEIRNNHATFAASSLFASLEYFRKYYPEITDLAGAYRGVENIFDGQRGSYKPDDDSGTYANYAPNHFLDYLFTREDWGYLEQGNLRKIADFVIMTVDNRGDLSTYGDEIEYKIGFDKALPLLAKAAWYHRDGRYLWARDWLFRRSTTHAFTVEAPFLNSARKYRGKTDFLYDGWYYGPYNVDLPRAVPSHLTGIRPMRMDDGLYRFARKFGTGAPIPIERTFDKLSLRRDFDPQNEYLLMSGLSGALSHSHEDGNAIVRLTWRDRVWLADMHYRRKLVNAHNSLLVQRGWRYQNIPTFTSLDGAVDFAETGFTATSVAGYNGVDWDRNLIWAKGAYLLVLDHVRVREPDDYCLTLNWRTLGETAFKDNALRVVQAGERFNIQSADESTKRFSEEPSDGRFVIWEPYEHAGDAVVRIMSQAREGAFARDEQVEFVNLLYPGADRAFQVRRIQPGVVQVLADDQVESVAGLAPGGCRVGPMDVTARVFRMTRARVSLVDVTRLSTETLLWRSEQPVSLNLDLASGAGQVNAAAPAEVSVNGGRVWLNGTPVALRRDLTTGLQSFALPTGTHELRIEPGPAWAVLARVLDVPAAKAGATGAQAGDSEAGLMHRWQRDGVSLAEVADLDGDGVPEAIVTVGDRVVALSSAGDERWSAKLNGNARIVLVQDIDADGRREVCVGTERGFVHVFEAQGTERWQRECAHRPGPITALTAADLDGDGRPELLAGSQGYVLYVFESSGQLKWRNPVDIPWGGVRAIVVRDFDGKPGPEIYVATGADHGDVMLTGDGRQLWRLSTTTSFAVATDLQGEGREQLLIGGPMKAGPLRLINPANGAALWNAGIDDDVRAILPLRMGETGKLDVLVGYAAAGLWRMAGCSEKRRLRSFPALVNTVIPLAEQAGSVSRLAVGCEDGTVLVVDSEGRTLASLKLARPVTSLRSLSLGGRPGLFVTTRNGAAAALEIATPNIP